MGWFGAVYSFLVFSGGGTQHIQEISGKVRGVGRAGTRGGILAGVARRARSTQGNRNVHPCTHIQTFLNPGLLCGSILELNQNLLLSCSLFMDFALLVHTTVS